MKNRIDTTLDFSFEKNSDRNFLRRELGRISLSGVQEKFSALVENGRFRLTREGEQGEFILKPAPMDPTLDSRKFLPVNEFVTMRIAREVFGISTADILLCKDSTGQYVLAVKRFDIREDGGKMPQEDFASILGMSEAGSGNSVKYSGTYADIAAGIRKYIAAWPPALEAFFRLVIFNYIFANGDAHNKNFSILRTGPEYVLSPAYDLLNTELHLTGSDFALTGGLSSDLIPSDIYESSGHPSHSDFEQFGRIIGLQAPRIECIVGQFLSLPPSVAAIVESSPLPSKFQCQYLRILKERHARFCR